MNDTKQNSDRILDGLKNIKKHHLNKKRDIIKKNNNKIDGLMLSRIEEFIEIGKGERGLLDTCVLNNLSKLLLNKNDDNKDDNMFGYTFDNKNNTIIKFNKSPNQLQIEQFTFPDKNNNIKKIGKKIYKMNNDSYDMDGLNNISENKENINFLKKFREGYESDLENNKKQRQIKSNIILCPKNLKKELRSNQFKNTVNLKQSDMDDFLKTYGKKLKNGNDKEKDNNEQKHKLKMKKDDSKKIKEKDNGLKIKKEDSKKIKDKLIFMDDDDNNIIESIKRRKKKSQTRKQQNENFLFNKGKKLFKKNTEFYISNNSVQKIDFDEKITNNDEDIKKNNKNKFKSNKNNTILRTCINGYTSDNKNPQKSTKTRNNNKKNKLNKFQSVLLKNNNLFESKNNLRPKRNSNAISKKELDRQDKDSDVNSLKISKKDKKYNNNNFEEKNNKERTRKNSNQNNIKVYKNHLNHSFESCRSKINNDSYKNNNGANTKKDINKTKKNIQKLSQYKIKHVNNIFVGRSENKNEVKNRFKVVKPENLISFEYNREYETRINKNNVIIIKNIQDNLNETNNKYKQDNNVNDSKNEYKKRSKSLFCCL